MMKTLRPPFFVFSAVFIALLLSACNLFQTSLTAYLTEEPGGKPPAGGGNEGGDDGPWVYVAADTGDDLKSGWSAGEAVKTISRALAVWSL
ncbi:MAG: hypothetical protein LBI86_11410, partial [Treponema sp.]|nr:hypothetical protein [Treponema sp.]